MILIPKRPNRLIKPTQSKIIAIFKDRVSNEIARESVIKEKVNNNVRNVNDASKQSIHLYLTGNHEEGIKSLVLCKLQTQQLVSDLMEAPLYMRQQVIKLCFS